jgi:NAD(P)-dependent dehydrogenase (short-subunit alcohol dehydrogenase family)
MSQVWFITGASRGIGAHIVRAALQAGHQVVASGRNLQQLRAAWPAADANLALVELDVTRAAQAEAAVQAAVERFGRIDVLVNNAGYGLLGHFEEIAADAIEQQFATNVFGLMHVLRATLPVMRRQRAGHVLNITSIGGVVGFGGSSVYCASKFAVEGLSNSLAPELARFGIKVTAVEPGFVRTDFLDASSVRYGSNAIADYATGATVKETFDGYSHRQPGDPARLALALVTLAAMANPPTQFAAGSDALAMLDASLRTRQQDIEAHADLSRSTDGAF